MSTVTNSRTILSTAWAGMLAILLAMLLIDPLQYLMRGQYEDLSQTLQHDPGTLGLRVLMVMLCLNTLMQVGIQMFSGPRWRSGVLAITTLYGLFFLVHQVVHVAGGEALGLHTLLDVTHHLLAIVATLAAWRWKKEDAASPTA
ncbi:hypothetical protein [Limnohabitans sp. T6-20]|uniref:hypothetical protein n=1 Tax=Limnohabitans sp. T6-20 TaxID=1100725 RepID=UPI000D3C390E|nr:hypothetical protein [Limnohabitans sp. T6-20]PUE07697.1 hypothetical protein B9Z33_12030 [Limnohabitans sp. T6-20]